jgi:hypothetical protein
MEFLLLWGFEIVSDFVLRVLCFARFAVDLADM